MKVLLCKPTHFRIDYSINPWMVPGIKIDKSKLLEEYSGLKQTYEALGVEVLEIEQQAEYPDMVYTSDWGFVHGDKFILSKFKNKERKGEQKIAKKFFTGLGYEIVTWTGRDYFEGGDLLARKDKLYFGWGKRSSENTIPKLEELTSKEVVSFRITDPYYYHLDTCVMPLDDNNVIYFPDALTMIEQAKISYHFSNPIPITEEDARNFACNLVLIDDNVIINDTVSKDLEVKLQTLGYKVHRTPSQEYIKGGGSIRCISLLFE